MRKFGSGVGLVVVCIGAISALGLVVQLPRKGPATTDQIRIVTAPRNSSSIKAGQAAPISNPQTPARVARQYGKLPLTFEPNLGQVNSEAKFLARGDGYAIFVTPTESILALNSSSKTVGIGGSAPSVLRMKLGGANTADNLTAIDELPGKSNYFIGNQPSSWHVNIPNYRRVEQKVFSAGFVGQRIECIHAAAPSARSCWRAWAGVR